MNQPGEHFERGRLARSVGAEEPDQFARFNVKADALDRKRLLVTAMEKAPERARETGLFFVRPKRLRQSLVNDPRQRAGDPAERSPARSPRSDASKRRIVARG